MLNYINKKTLQVSAIALIAITSGAADANAGRTFSDVSDNIETSISGLPNLLAGLSYMLGILLAVLGILKIKDHVENPTSEKLSHGAIRLAAGGALFSLPIVFESMQSTIQGTGGSGIEGIVINKVGTSFDLK